MIVEAEPQMTPEQRKNWEAALRINRETRANPDSPYTGKYLTVLNGEVIAQGKDLTEMTANLRALGIDHSQSVGIEASLDYDRTYHIGNFYRLEGRSGEGHD